MDSPGASSLVRFLRGGKDSSESFVSLSALGALSSSRFRFCGDVSDSVVSSFPSSSAMGTATCALSVVSPIGSVGVGIAVLALGANAYALASFFCTDFWHSE